jgi:hypothetical protein
MFLPQDHEGHSPVDVLLLAPEAELIGRTIDAACSIRREPERKYFSNYILCDDIESRT